MARYIVTYDLDKPGQNYPRLINELNRLGALHLQDSVWELTNTANTVAIRDHLLGFMDANDRLLVAELTGVAAWNNSMVANQQLIDALAA